MKFDDIYYKLLDETNLAGGDGVFGSAAGDGDMDTGWTDNNVFPAMGLFGDDTKAKKEKKKKKKKNSVKVHKRPDIGSI